MKNNHRNKGFEDFIELQFSVHSTSNEYRKWLQNSNVISNEMLGNFIIGYSNAFPNKKWKVTLNFSLAENTPFDVNILKEQFNPKNCFIKISNINENEVSNKNNLKSKIGLKNII